jgi:hypothetical protein
VRDSLQGQEGGRDERDNDEAVCGARREGLEGWTEEKGKMALIECSGDEGRRNVE